MESHGAMLPWNTSADIDHSTTRPAGNFNINSRPMSQPTGQPRPTTTIVQVCADVKPRLTKDQHEILERHFQAQPKPSTNTKKGFADALGVPLDKINNWFQNRRAKVKQDHKKQINAIQLFQATLAQHSQHYLTHPHSHPHPQPMPSPLPQYYGPLPVLPSSETPADATSSPSSTHNEPHQNGSTASSSDVMQSTQPQSRNGVEAPLSQFPMQVSAPEGMHFGGQPYPDPQFTFTDGGFDNFGAPFDFPAMPDTFDFNNQLMQPQLQMNPVPEPSSFRPASQSASPHTMPSQMPGFSQFGQTGEERKATSSVDSPQTATDSSAETRDPTPAESNSTWCSNSQLEEFYKQQNNSGLVFQDDHETPVPNTVNEIRRNSTAELAASMNSVEIDQSSEGGRDFSIPVQPLGLAARRKKALPANLGTACIRSTSYSAGMPSPSGVNPNLATQDQHLRRIRSHGITNVGRISKVSGQKSPMHANFEAAVAASSPKFVRHAANYSVSTISSSGPLTATTAPGSLAPPTPCTPYDINGRFPSWQAPATGKFSQFHGSPGAFSHAGDDAMYVNASSPLLGASVEFQQEQQYLAQQARTFNHAPPQSAPATQQHFGPSAHGPPPTQMMQPSSKGASHMRRPSLPGPNHAQEPQMQYYPESLNGLQMQFNGQAPATFNNQPVPFTMTENGPVPMMPPQMAWNPQFSLMYADPPKQITFSNHGPEDFHNGMLKK